MALPDNLVTLSENIMARRWWTDESKRELDQYSAAVLNVCLEAVAKIKDLTLHPLVESILQHDESISKVNSVVQQNNNCWLTGLEAGDCKKGLPGNFHLGEIYQKDYHDISMPDVWCACCCKDVLSSKNPEVTTEDQAEQDFSFWDFNINPLLALDYNQGNCQLEEHLKDYRKYVNRLSTGGWYTTKVSDESHPGSKLDHLYVKPLAKALRAQTYKDYLVDGNIPNWLYKLHRPEIKAIWSDESDLESDSDHDLSGTSDQQSQLLDVNLLPSGDFEDVDHQVTELSHESRAWNWFNLDGQPAVPQMSADSSPNSITSNQAESVVPLMEWKCLSDANKCLNQAVLGRNSVTSSNSLQCSIAKLPSHRLNPQHEEPIPIQNTIGQPMQDNTPIHYNFHNEYSSINSANSDYFNVRETSSAVTLPASSSQLIENDEKARTVQILQRKQKSLSNWDTRPMDRQSHLTDSELQINANNKDDKQQAKGHLQMYHNLPTVQSEPVLPISAYLCPKMPAINLSRTRNNMSANYKRFDCSPEKDAMGDSDAKRYHTQLDLPTVTKLEKTNMGEGQSMSVQSARPARGSRSGRVAMSVTPSQWAAMWPPSMPTRSTFGSQVVQYNSMGRPMRINLPKQQSIRITHSGNYLHQQSQAQSARLRRGMSTGAQPHTQTSLNSINAPSTQIQTGTPSISAPNYVMTSTARRPKQLTLGRQRTNLIQIPLQDNIADSRFAASETPLKGSASMPAVQTPMQQCYSYNSEYPPLRQKLGPSIQNSSSTFQPQHREGMDPYYVHCHDLQNEYHSQEAWPSLQEAHGNTMPTVPSATNSQWVPRPSQNTAHIMSQRNLSLNMNHNNNNCTSMNNNTSFRDRLPSRDISSNTMKYHQRISHRVKQIEDSVKLYKVLFNSLQKDGNFLMSSLEMPPAPFSSEGME